MRDFSKLFEPVVESMGYELVGVEFLGAGGHDTLRVYIDRDSGVSLDDCAAISHQISKSYFCFQETETGPPATHGTVCFRRGTDHF